ncbi:partial Sporulation initiation phosphotransferase F, partial [Methylococcales bacterium]
MHIAYLFTSQKFGLDLVLKQLGIEPVIKVLSPDKNGIMKKELNRLIKKILNSKPDESLLIFYDDEDAISLLEEFRFKYSIASSFLILSFTTQDKIEKRFTMSPRTNRPIMSFGKGMYHLQLPAKIDKLRDILREAVPVETTGMDYVKDEYGYSLTYQKDANFRHRCANLASAIRILQGAYYTSDIGKPDYLSAIESIKQRSNKIPGLKSYGEIISSYLDSFDDGKQCLSPGIYISKSLKPTRILLLDDEAITSGWDIVLETVFNKQDYSISSGTDREKCINEIESKEELDFDILLLDLMMPDLPERSIHLIERMTDRHPHIPIIVFSALTDLPYFRKCQEAGAFNYFAKELGSDDRDPEKYYQKLKEILSNA